MQKLGLSHILGQKLSPQQIQFIKLLQIPTAELESRIEEELEINPALEEGREEASPEEEKYGDEEYQPADDENLSEREEEVNVEDYLKQDDGGYKMQGDGGGDDDDRESPIVEPVTLHDLLIQQLGYFRMDERKETVAKQLIGSIDEDGYVRRELSQIVNDLAFSQNVETSIEEVEAILMRIQEFDPAGIGARNLQECLLLQLERKHDDYDTVNHALSIVQDNFDEFTKKHYDKIQKKLDISDEEMKAAIHMITRLNPKPGGSSSGDLKAQYIIPDFILINNNNKLELTLNSRNAPELKISRSYVEMFDTYDKSAKQDKKLKEAVTFVKQKLDAAKWFIDAIRQRQQTLLKTMDAIVRFQYDFFLEGDEAKLRPMILKDIATDVGMDISTISRVANSKTVQTEFGIYPLKYFFSEGIATDSGEDASSREVKHILKELIEKEEKIKPLSDEKLEKLLNEKGYNIARRTVAKYREQLNIPVARLRKEI